MTNVWEERKKPHIYNRGTQNWWPAKKNLCKSFSHYIGPNILRTFFIWCLCLGKRMRQLHLGTEGSSEGENCQKIKNAINPFKINFLIFFKSLYHIFFKVGENKVSSEFWFFNWKVDFLALFGFLPKKPKYGQNHTFYLKKCQFEGTFT